MTWDVSTPPRHHPSPSTVCTCVQIPGIAIGYGGCRDAHPLGCAVVCTVERAREGEQCSTFARRTVPSCNLLQYQPPLVTVSLGRPSFMGDTERDRGVRVRVCTYKGARCLPERTPYLFLFIVLAQGLFLFFPSLSLPIMSTAPIVSRCDWVVR